MISSCSCNKLEHKIFLECPPPDVPIVQVTYDVYRLWHKRIIKFPKAERYSLGAVTGQTILDLLKQILIATATRDKVTKLRHLQNASALLDLAKLLVRLSKDCDCLVNEHYLELESQLHTAGNMLGGWIRSLS
ncbi:MAG: four helix bundle protein [Patescibacteria group bacterium]